MKYNIVIFLIITFNSCNCTKRQYTNLKKNNDYLKFYKPIKYIQNIRTKRIENFDITIDTVKKLRSNNIDYYKITITGFNDSIFIGLSNNVLYSYDQSINYGDITFFLDIKKVNYYSFFCGYDYRVDFANQKFDTITNDTIFNFHMEKLKTQKGNDYFYYANKPFDKIFKEINFSKKRGVISALLFDEKTKEYYRTLSAAQRNQLGE